MTERGTFAARNGRQKVSLSWNEEAPRGDLLDARYLLEETLKLVNMKLERGEDDRSDASAGDAADAS